VVSFSEDWEGFSWRLRVAPAPRVPRAARPIINRNQLENWNFKGRPLIPFSFIRGKHPTTLSLSGRGVGGEGNQPSLPLL